MADNELYYRWEWHFKTSPDVFWPYFADTNRFNYDRGNPGLQNLTPGDRLPNAYRRLGLTISGMPQIYDEEPFEWVKPYRHSVNRTFREGLFEGMRLLAELSPAPDGGSIGVYHSWVRPRGLLGKLLMPYLMNKVTFERFDKAFRKYDRLAAAGEAAAALRQGGPISFVEGGEERLKVITRDLLDQGADSAVLDRLVDHLRSADNLTASRIQPYVLADAWGLARRSVLETCLLATRSGLLEFRWEVICPLCRGAKVTSTALNGIKSQVHCSTCNADFTANFDRTVELTFRPNPAIREYETQDFCVAGPEVTPHIVAQQLLKPYEHRSLTLELEPGRYRLRALELPGGQFFSATAEGGESTIHLPISTQGWPDSEQSLSLTPAVTFDNTTHAEQLIIFERTAWSDQSATAAEVIAMQAFRDLFSSEALRPGEQISVGGMTIVFTDLRGSTGLYREVGDASAFGMVMSHFDVLRRTIDKHEGAIVKTIGDAVMAVFRRPLLALQAMLAAQRELASPDREHRSFELRVGINSGPCVAVSLNERLDYFGSTINMAARLEGLSTGGEVVISESVRQDPEVAAWLEANREALLIQQVESSLKGFEGERFDLYLIAYK